MFSLMRLINEKVKHRNTLRACARCGSFIPKINKTCHYCSELTDEEVKRGLAERKHFRVSLGKIMLLASVVLLLLMILV